MLVGSFFLNKVGGLFDLFLMVWLVDDWGIDWIVLLLLLLKLLFEELELIMFC